MSSLQINQIKQLQFFGESVFLANLESGEESIQISEAGITQQVLQGIDFLLKNCSEKNVVYLIKWLPFCLKYNINLENFVNTFRQIKFSSKNYYQFYFLFKKLKQQDSQVNRIEFWHQLISPNNLNLFVYFKQFSQIVTYIFNEHQFSVFEEYSKSQQRLIIKIFIYFVQSWFPGFSQQFLAETLAKLFARFENLVSFKCCNMGNKVQNLGQVEFPRNLQILNLSNNKLQLQEEIVFPPNLEWLILSCNEIKSMRQFKFQGNSLVYLNLNNNNLKRVEAKDFPESLVELYLNFNYLRFEEEITFGGNLQRVEICGNRIKALKNIFFGKNLNYLDLSFNQLKSLENIPQTIINLKLSQNCIQRVSEIIFPNSLQFLDLSFNQIKEISKVIFNKNLKSLCLKGNNLEVIKSTVFLGGELQISLSQNPKMKKSNFPKNIQLIISQYDENKEKRKNKRKFQTTKIVLFLFFALFMVFIFVMIITQIN